LVIVRSYPIRVVLAAAALAMPGAAWALTVHALVLADPHDGADGLETARAVERRLRDSLAYDLVDPETVASRLGDQPSSLFRTCGDDAGCWRRAAGTMGVEELVLVEQIDVATLGIRVLDTVGDSPFRLDQAPVGPAHLPDGELLQRLFFAPGTLTVRVLDAPTGLRLVVDGSWELPIADGRLDIPAIAAGKHTVEITGFDVPFFATVMVGPGASVDVEFTAPASDAPKRVTRWTTWAALGLVTAGAAGLVVGANAPSAGR
jgi:hypothetical protein